MVLNDTMDVSQIPPLPQLPRFSPVADMVDNNVESVVIAAISPNSPAVVLTNNFLVNHCLVFSQEMYLAMGKDEMTMEMDTTDHLTTTEPSLAVIIESGGSAGVGNTSGMTAEALAYVPSQREFPMTDPTINK